MRIPWQWEYRVPISAPTGWEEDGNENDREAIEMEIKKETQLQNHIF
jgi:hypothetical protein